ncbi:hypothetical protein B484DRAFT_402969, partial [Ochromonadaceae sp. CCMP2298]
MLNNKVRPPPVISDAHDDNERLMPTSPYSPGTRSWRRYLQTVFNPFAGPKPPSNPYGWPYSTEEDVAERPARIVKLGSEQTFSFASNFVKTSKYELWNFLGKFLIEEFDPVTKIANCYFLGIAGLQCIAAISNTGGIPTNLVPLFFILLIDGTFQSLEDVARHRADRTSNASEAWRYDPSVGDFIICKWFEICVGDFIRIQTREMVPADVVILSVAEKTHPAQGICYVETKSLDGETNLKMRTALPSTLGEIPDAAALRDVVGQVEMEHPNKLIDSFSGVVSLSLKDKSFREPIQAGNMLLRGCVLRNTSWIIGLVVNTGHDTKIMMSSASTKTKRSSLEVQCSNEIVRIIVLLAAVCVTGALGQALWNSQNDVSTIWYLKWDPEVVSFWFIDFFYFFLLHATFIPVSLYVSMSVIRYFQGYFMMMDRDMYYARTDTASIVRTLTLNEELGQVSHVFSDKTGTLTCNVMDFRKASINGISYGLGITEIGKAAWKLLGKPIAPEILEGELRAKAAAVAHVSFYSPLFDQHMKGPQKGKIQEFYRILAICHDVIPEKVEGKIKLSASNPDDEALVCAAEYFGFRFTDRVDKMSVVHNRESGVDEQVETLCVLAFTSKRKRMSVIIRDIDGKIKIFCKGADTTMLPRLRAGQDTLRYDEWHEEYMAACSDLQQIEKKKAGLANRIEELEDRIEADMACCGATAIEDRLQDGVPECIAELSRAGVNIWVLTGDKEETAINIAVACNLVLPQQYMDHIIVNPSTASSEEPMRALFTAEIKRYDIELEGENGNADALKPRALIIDGPSLIIAMGDTTPDGLKDLLLDLSQRCRAVVGCRVSPDQKREMVNMIKTGLEGVRTLAIGDGANDVAMIQEAHIGVGIKGEEGLQAVNSSDYAIGQFRFLSQLMLKHGRWNYIRMSNAVCYIFYKNILMSIAQFWFNFSCAFSGQKYYTEGVIQMFNFVYTNFPLLMMGVYDMDI